MDEKARDAFAVGTRGSQQVREQMLRAITYLVILVAVFAVSGCDETRETYYPTYRAAVSAGAISRGWIPGWLPKSARDIHEKHDIATNQRMLAFRFNGSERVAVGNVCEPIGPFKAKGPPFRVSWWPGDVPARRLSTYRHSFYSCESGTSFLALSEKRGEGFYWSP